MDVSPFVASGPSETGRELGCFSKPRLEDGDILLNGSTAYANAGNHLTLAGKRRSTHIGAKISHEPDI
jgi:hypothetical protein